jgi:hypothetical protein
MTETTQQPKRKRKYPLKYNEAAVILYLLSMEITNLLKEIHDKSPIESKQLPEESLFTPEQIAEARQHFTGFVKQAIAVVARRQVALNLIAERKQQIKQFFIELEDGAALALQNPSYISEDGFRRVERALKSLKKDENEMLDIEDVLRKHSKIINEQLAKSSYEWKKHQIEYVNKLVVELEDKGIQLSELEKQELQEAKKTIDEVRQSLRKQALIKEEKK